jgi:glycosyltransferase involved in cell wall biosynthesis
MKIRVAILHPIIAPYRIPLFDNLSKEADLEVKIFQDVQSMSNRPFWQANKSYFFDHECVEAVKVRLPWKIKRKDVVYTENNFSWIPLKLPLYLKSYLPDVIISTELGVRTLLAGIYAKIYKKKMLVWSVEYLIGIRKHTTLRINFRKLLAKKIDGFCSCGAENKKYLEHLGVAANKIFNVGNVVDNSYFQTNATTEARKKIRKELGLSGTVFFNIGQLIGRKAIDRLIRIWATLPDRILKDSMLIIIGGGTEEDNLKNLSKALGLLNVLFIPPKTLSELPSFYAAGDVFIFPTLEDGWGLVINEAMACGKPILCSKYAGCCPELIQEGVNGYSFDPLDEDNTRGAIIRMFNKNPKELEIMGEKSKKIISGFTYDRMLNGFKKAIYSCLNKRM